MSIREERKRASRETLVRENAPPYIVSEGRFEDPRAQLVIDFVLANLRRRVLL
jgi:hypothetical protein